ncbi:hypothetical protein Aduo_016151 [Ancylostoma duodenale]
MKKNISSTTAQKTTGAEQFHNRRHIHCVQGGVEITSQERNQYEICAGDFCISLKSPQEKEIIKFPPQVTLHEHNVQWKFLNNDSIGILETTCPAAPFCDQVDCIICSATIFNPECWPLGAILGTALVLYFLLTGCYVFLYVPLQVGKPVRIFTTLLWQCTKFLIRKCYNCIQRKNRTRRYSTDLIELLAVVITLLAISAVTQGCQQINLFSHKSTICTNSEGTEVCKIHISEILKINPFKREACFKLQRYGTTLHEIRASWKALLLTCEAETEMFTRDTTYHVVDSKRCPHTGSCVGAKCAAVSPTSKIPELDKGNHYPGITTCVESCGGVGCDCFYWSSGCLFYCIYATPTSPQVYEIFHCNRWTEAAKIKLSQVDIVRGRKHSFIANMMPNIPIKWNSFTFTLSSITVPPIPLLNSAFITDGNSTAIWDTHITPPLQCPNRTAAEVLACTLCEDCKCYPAENQANCQCRDVNISKAFNDVSRRLPTVFPSITFKLDPEQQVQAIVPGMTTAEIIVTIQDDVKSNVLVDDAICSIDNAVLTGCYNCAKRAATQITCKSSQRTQAEVTCGSTSFTVDCDQKGVPSTLHFHG